jgi:hypothetical protein
MGLHHELQEVPHVMGVGDGSGRHAGIRFEPSPVTSIFKVFSSEK